ncbi:MAG: hypothetical protein SFU85_07250 [Candidatus Methylacidiphilales bacterium]|nr:hypothetical protein [Candidatus Methylacidiphilales bacterium]
MDFREPTPEMKQKVFNEILYEIEMLVSLPMDSPQSLLHNVLTEAYFLHTRVLVEFFQTEQRIDNQVLCSDYGFPPEPIDPLKEIEARHHQYITHLTYGRLKPGGTSRSWIQKNFDPKLRKRITGFLLHIIKSRPVTLDEDQTGRAMALVRQLAK